MKKTLRFTLLPALLFAFSAAAQNWSVGAATGAFKFGDFVTRTLRAGTETSAGSASQIKLAGTTRAGLSLDLERSFSDRFAVRLEGTFTHAPIAVRDEGGSSIGLDAGKLDVTTLMVPLVFRINPRGAFRIHLMGGPAYAAYHIKRQTGGVPQLTAFEGTRGRWGAAAGAGVGWWFSDRLAVEGQVTDITTASPFERSDFAANSLIKIPRTRNVHTTAGVRLRF
jgi:hypothetical protein